jgi:hypothetical protein
LETNYFEEKRFIVKHWVDTRGGGHSISDERSIYEAVANQGARRKRACLLAVIPGDVVDAAVNQCKLTLATKVKLTPERVTNMVNAFADYGVTREMVEKKIQRRVDSITPALFVQLSKVFTSLKDGMSKPSDWFEMEATATEPVKGNEGVKAKLRERTKKAESEEAPK